MGEKTRRWFLQTGGIAGSFGVAGCLRLSGDQEANTPTREPTQTDTPTSDAPQTEPEATDAGAEPAVTQFEPVLQRLDYDRGDQIAPNTTPAFGQTGEIFLGHETTHPTHDGRAVFTHTVSLKKDGEQVDSYEFDTQSEDVPGQDSYQSSWWTRLVADTEREIGQYTAEVSTTDIVTDETATATTELGVNRDLQLGDIEFVEVEAPETVSVGEEYSTVFRVRNLTDRASSYSSPASYRIDSSDWQQSDDPFTMNLRADGITEFEPPVDPFDDPVGELSIRIDDPDITFSMTVTE